jgi:hypothetical protein
MTTTAMAVIMTHYHRHGYLLPMIGKLSSSSSSTMTMMMAGAKAVRPVPLRAARLT